VIVPGPPWHTTAAASRIRRSISSCPTYAVPAAIEGATLVPCCTYTSTCALDDERHASTHSISRSNGW
jgi:hypothetical protein